MAPKGSRLIGTYTTNTLCVEQRRAPPRAAARPPRARLTRGRSSRSLAGRLLPLTITSIKPLDMATDAKVDTELADEIDQTGWMYTYAWNPSKDSYRRLQEPQGSYRGDTRCIPSKMLRRIAWERPFLPRSSKNMRT